MSEESNPDLVELARRAFGAFRSGDLDTMMGFYASNAVVSPHGGLGALEGKAQIREFFEIYLGSFDDLEYESQAIHDFGNGIIFAVVHQDGRPVGSGAHVRTVEGWGAVFIGAKIVRGWTSSPLDEARATAERLAEEP